MVAPKKSDPALLVPFAAGEQVTIQRTVKGQNVLMFAEVIDPCALGPNRMVLTARPSVWGVSSYADGRVSRQAGSIERLTEERRRVLEIAIANGFTEIVDLLTGEGTGNDNDTEAAEVAAPQQLINPDGSGYQD